MTKAGGIPANLADDPMEQEDLSKDKAHGNHLEQMQGELAEWQRSVIRSLNGQDYSSIVTE